MTQIKSVSLYKLINVAQKTDGKKIFELERRIHKEDLKLCAVLDTDDTVYVAEEDLDFYDYKLSTEVFFDDDLHPYWNASFEEHYFKLYDSLFIGHHGCTGYEKYIKTIKKAKHDLSCLPRFHHILQEFNRFLKDYELKKKQFMIRKLRSKFNIIKEKIDEETEVLQYLRYENDNYFKKDKDILIFWQWFENRFIDEEEYLRKEKIITKNEHKQAFQNYLDGIIVDLKNIGFRRLGEIKNDR